MNLHDQIEQEKELLSNKITKLIQKFVDNVGLTPSILISTGSSSEDGYQQKTMSCRILLEGEDDDEE